MTYDGFACEGHTLEDDAPIVTAVGRAIERTSGTWPRIASTATTDARSFVLTGGSPALCFGPRAENVHGVDERVLLPSMVETRRCSAS